MRSFRFVLTGLAMLGGGLVGFSAPAAAQPAGHNVRCGDTLTANTTLHRDLVNCPGSGLVIGADNLTLDLNGHTLDADAAAGDCSQGNTCDLGVDNTAGFDGITIKGGRITDFSFGVVVVGAPDNVLSRLSVSRQRLAGVMFIESTGGRVERNSITRNGLTTDFAGMNVFGSTGLVIEGNDISQSGDIGLFLVDESSRNTIRHNRFADNPESGILIGGDDNIVDGNIFLRDGGGLGLGGNRNRVTSNVVLDIPAACGEEGCGPGLQVEEGSSNVISGNVVRRVPTGIAVEAFGPSTAGTIVSDNVVDSAYGDGISVDVIHPGGAATNTQVERNVVTRAGDDGIEVGGASATLTGNLVLDNGDLGIEAVAGVTDGGGNTAAGNGNPLQCTNVRCDTYTPG
jgi:parallel beta-helix repeat protein